MIQSLVYFMAFTASSQPCHDDWLSAWYPDLVAVAREFTIDKLNPRWPMRGALSKWEQSDGHYCRQETWDETASRWRSYAEGECNPFSPDPYADCEFETRLMVGTLELPIELLQAAHKRLFGEVTDEPASEDVRAIGCALFHWQTFGYTYRDGKTWKMYCKNAEANSSPDGYELARRERVKGAVADLLTELND